MAAFCSLSPWSICLPLEGATSQPLVPLIQTLQVEEREQAQLLVGQTSWDKFVSGSLLTGCAAERWGS